MHDIKYPEVFKIKAYRSEGAYFLDNSWLHVPADHEAIISLT